MKPENVMFFESAADFRAWLAENHDAVEHQWLGFLTKGAARPGLTYPQAVEEALCFGWIDGQGGPVDEHSRAVRFTPRRARSVWSAVNVRRMEALIAAGRVAEPGMRAFAARRDDRTAVYGYESAPATLPVELEERFRAHADAWDFWNRQPPGYRRQMTWWVVSAKREETRTRRLSTLIAEHAAGRRIDPLRPGKPSDET